jgi:hypothetical protein
LDADSDTKIQVEESSDEDKIRFDTGGTERMVLDSGSLTVTPKIVSDAGIDIDNFNIDGTTIALSTGSMTLDAASAIKLDADGGEVAFLDGGTEIGVVSMGSSNMNIESKVADKDIIFKGIDGSSDLTALTLDMSDAGKAIFNKGLTNVAGSQDIALNASSSSDTTRFMFQYQGGNQAWIERVNNTGGMAFSVASTERMRVDGSGNLLVGTTSNSTGRRVHIESASGGSGQLGLRDSAATSGKYWRIGPNSSNNIVVTNQSGVGVYMVDGATSWTGNSDENLKENIVELTGALDKVKDFRCVEYNFIADKTKSKKIGFIAQDWQKDYSQVVSQNNDGNLGIQYTETIPVLLKAIQEQQEQIEQLKTEIQTLKGE